ncbi:probable WRKY transcription factor 53 isoform X2 [Papaver somniferum]|uniref:probable WRKY transcription factor 53 isoform X2 n=1 Tax=Papaver somniferum TaxID=3469 RepID=UPI000E6F673F|nr:probable WRKY transcription factor 53 isoform X2 [Papaver somniferum]
MSSLIKMENSTSMSYLDQNQLLLNELVQAKDLPEQSETDLGTAASTNVHLSVPIILSSFEESLSRLTGIKSEFVNEPQTTGSTDSRSMVNGGPRSDCDSDLGSNPYKKRKTVQTWTEQVHVCEKTGLQGPIADGYSWKKYGQKDILGAKHPRCARN